MRSSGLKSAEAIETQPSPVARRARDARLAADEAKIEATRRRGATPKEGPDVPIGVTGFTPGDVDEG